MGVAGGPCLLALAHGAADNSPERKCGRRKPPTIIFAISRPALAETPVATPIYTIATTLEAVIVPAATAIVAVSEIAIPVEAAVLDFDDVGSGFHSLWKFERSAHGRRCGPDHHRDREHPTERR